MRCEKRVLPDGSVVIVCTSGRRKRCSAPGCSSSASKLCDFPVNVKGRKSRTCDADLCASHAVSVGEELDYCPPHARYVRDHGEPEPEEPAQRELFGR